MKYDKTNKGYFNWRPIYFLIICHSVLPRMRSISGNSYRENQNTQFIFSNFILKNSAIYEVMWKNIADTGRPQMTIWCMHIACWLPKIHTQESKDLICAVAETWNHPYQNFKGYFISCPWCMWYLYKDIALIVLTHWGRVMHICVFALQPCRTGDANLRFWHMLGFYAIYT